MSDIPFLKNWADQSEMPIIVRGHSMEPAYHDGDILRITRAFDYQIGDIIVFRYDGIRIIHRIIGIKGEYFFCKGDHARAIQKITKDSIIGKVVL